MTATGLASNLMASVKSPSTPPREQSSGSLSVLQYTSIRQGSGSHTSHDTENHQSDYASYLQHDLCHTKHISYERRVLRNIVLDELSPIKSLASPADLDIVFRDVFNCYRWLHEEAKILHRDISEANIMGCSMNDGRICGVLNDFDHAIRVDTSDPLSSHERTGTMPYMAIDLLESSPPPAHLYRHDLESLYYVLVCVLCPNSPDVKDWFLLERQWLTCSKVAFFTRPCFPPRPGLEIFSKWLVPIHLALIRGFRAQTDAKLGLLNDWNDETFGGHITLEKFADIFNKQLVAPSG